MPYNAPASSFVLKYCSNMRSTCRPLTTRLDCASMSLKVRICLSNSPFATFDNWAKIYVSSVTKFWGLPSSAMWPCGSFYLHALHIPLVANPKLHLADRTPHDDLYFSGVGNSGNRSVSASLVFDPVAERDALPPKANSLQAYTLTADHCNQMDPSFDWLHLATR